jgi:hypothetical protein
MLLMLIFVMTSSESRAKLSQGRYGCRQHRASLLADRPAINSTQLARREGKGGRPEIGERLTTVENRCTGEVFNAVDVQQHTEGDTVLPLIRHVFLDANPGREAARPFVDQRAP